MSAGAGAAFASVAGDIMNAYVSNYINERNIQMTKETNEQNERLMLKSIKEILQLFLSQRAILRNMFVIISQRNKTSVFPVVKLK